MAKDPSLFQQDLRTEVQRLRRQRLHPLDIRWRVLELVRSNDGQ